MQVQVYFIEHIVVHSDEWVDTELSNLAFTWHQGSNYIEH